MEGRDASIAAADASSDDQLIKLLWAYDEKVVSGSQVGIDSLLEPDDDLDLDTCARLEQAQAAIELLSWAGPSLAAASAINGHGGQVSSTFSSAAEAMPICGNAAPNNGPTELWDALERLSSSSDLPRRLGRFEIVRELGRGGLGVVLFAYDPVLRRHVALKLPRPEALLTPALRRRFSIEAQAAARLTHPNLVSVYEVGQVGPICYIASAYCDGPNLATWLHAGANNLSAQHAAALVAALADAMQYAHSQGVLHRDLKPSNVLLEPCPELPTGSDGTTGEVGFTPKITDFGLAKLEDLSGDCSRTGLVLGTPAYMAPEQAEGRLNEINVRTDVYGLGAILFELLTGQPPCAGNSEADTLRRVLSDEPSFRGGEFRALPADLRAITLKCLEKEPRRRYRSAGELAADLRRFLTGQPTHARPLGLLGRTLKWARRRPTAAALVFVSAAAAVTVLAGSLYYSARTTLLFNFAEASRREAEEKQETLRHYLYAADMPLAYKAYQRNNLSQMKELLSRHIPHQGEEDLRSFAWHFLDQLCHAERLTLRGHEGEVFTVQYSGDGKLLATCGKDGTVRLWNATDGRLLATLQANSREVNCLTFSPDASKLVTGGEDRAVHVWDVARAIAGQAEGRQPAQTHALSGIVSAVAISPGSETLAVGVGEAIEFFPLEPSGIRYTLDGQKAKVTSIDFARDGRSVLLAAGRSLAHWDLSTRVDRARRDVHDRTISAIALAHGGDLIASVDHGGNVQLCNTANLEPIAALERQIDRIDAVAFSPDDRILAVGGGDRMVELWDVATRHVTEIIRGHTGWVWSADFSPDGTTIATASSDGTVRIWGTTAANPRRFVAQGPDRYHRCVSFSHDSRLLAAADNAGNIEIWDWQTGVLHAAWRAHWTPVGPEQAATGAAATNAVAFSPTGGVLASSGDDGVVRLWDCATWHLRAEFFGAVGGALSFTPDGRSLSVGASSETACARIWNLDTGICRAADYRLAGANPVLLVDTDVSVSLARIGLTLELIRQSDDSSQWMMSLVSASPQSLAVSPDGHFLATGGSAIDRVVHLWQTATGNYLGSLVGHGSEVSTIAFCADGRTLAGGGSTDGRVRLWDLYSRQELLTFEPSVHKIWQLAFSPDGRLWQQQPKFRTAQASFAYGSPVRRPPLDGATLASPDQKWASKSKLASKIRRRTQSLIDVSRRRPFITDIAGDCITGSRDTTPAGCQPSKRNVETESFTIVPLLSCTMRRLRS